MACTTHNLEAWIDGDDPARYVEDARDFLRAMVAPKAACGRCDKPLTEILEAGEAVDFSLRFTKLALPSRAINGGRMSSVDGMEKLNEEIAGSSSER